MCKQGKQHSSCSSVGAPLHFEIHCCSVQGRERLQEMAGRALPRGEGLSSEVSACALAGREVGWSASGLEQFWWLQLVLRARGSTAVVQAGCALLCSALHPQPCSTKAVLGAELLCLPICLCH